MNHDILALLKVHEYFRGISDEALRDVMVFGKVRQFAVGEIVHQPEGFPQQHPVYFEWSLESYEGRCTWEGNLPYALRDAGEQMGMMLAALQEPLPVRIIALEPTVILEIAFEDAMTLSLKHPDLRQLWLRANAGAVRQVYFGATQKRAPMILGLIHQSPLSHTTAVQLINRLCKIGENIAVFSDAEHWQEMPGVRYRSMSHEGRPLTNEEIRRQAIEWQDANRIVFDVDSQFTQNKAVEFMQLVDRAIFFVPASESEAAVNRLRSMEVVARGWRDKLCVAWLLDEGRIVAPIIRDMQDYVCRDFKIATTSPQSPLGQSLNNGLERLVHDLRGVRIGVALGGGAARGMSHLGILKALEQSGIVVDMIAGTSAGALTGIVYASGLDASYSASQFSSDLKPSWPFRLLPRSNQWYLLYKYRRGHFEPMLRNYLHDWRLEQLCIPCCTVTVDLVGGNSVVRGQGDAVHAVLESINLPVLSAPIVRSGQALVDGGLVNNIPANVLVSLGCNFVIAVTVTAKIEKKFCEITPEQSILPRKRPGVVQTILRSLLVQNCTT